ncbi:phosphatase PAP2 family protein [Patulibacter sp. S7RM1-6]
MLAVLVAAFVVLGLLVRPSGLGDALDERGLRALGTLHRDPDGGAWRTATALGEPAAYALFGLALVLVALVRRRPRWAVLVPLTMIGSELTAQGLKRLLAAPRPGVPSGASVGDAAWPSGHSTAAMTVALLAILLAPPRLRPPVAAVGLLGALAVGLGMAVTGSHYPTDVLGGYLCAAIWVVLAVLVRAAWGRRRPAERPAGADA